MPAVEGLPIRESSGGPVDAGRPTYRMRCGQRSHASARDLKISPQGREELRDRMSRSF